MKPQLETLVPFTHSDSLVLRGKRGGYKHAMCLKEPLRIPSVEALDTKRRRVETLDNFVEVYKVIVRCDYVSILHPPGVCSHGNSVQGADTSHLFR